MKRVKVGYGRVIVRDVPGFTWVQVGISRKWKWKHWWAVRGFARSHQFGFLWVCTMRKDAIKRIRDDSTPLYVEVRKQFNLEDR